MFCLTMIVTLSDVLAVTDVVVSPSSVVAMSDGLCSEVDCEFSVSQSFFSLMSVPLFVWRTKNI